MPRLSKIVTQLIIIGFLITSCNSKDNFRNIEITPVKISIERLDQELFDPQFTMNEKNLQAKNKYGEFYSIYSENLLNLGSANDPALVGALKGFVSDADVKSIYNETNKRYSDLSEIEASLNSAFGRYKTAFPEKLVPMVVSFISGFNTKLAITDSILGIGLDLYLGPQNDFYEMLRYPQYKRAGLSKEFIPRDAIYGWVSTEFDTREKEKYFLEAIVKKGKLLYVLDCLMPEIHDSLKIGYSKAQMEWAATYEPHFWGIVIEEKLLFETSISKYYKYLQDGPFTSGLDHSSPPRYGEWLGWKIVRSFMKNNQDVDLRALLEMSDAQELLNKSGYKPQKS